MSEDARSESPIPSLAGLRSAEQGQRRGEGGKREAADRRREAGSAGASPSLLRSLPAARSLFRLFDFSTFRLFLLPLTTCLLVAGCSWYIDDADKQVHQLIASRQAAALGETHSTDLGKETGGIGPGGGLYDFVPHPVDPGVPDAFRHTKPATSRPADGSSATTQPAAELQILDLADCFAYALQHARDYQSAKEDLYVVALDLTLERHLWTPRFSGSVQSHYTNYGQVRDFDHAMDAIAQVAVEQKLPLGGTVTARVLDDWVRDIGNHATVGETGQAILEADIPLLRGAGRVAYESRYQAERKLIYAVRSFERFRREFLVNVAGAYFDLLSARARIESAKDSAHSFLLDMDRSRALALAGQKGVIPVEAARAEVQYLFGQNRVVIEETSYQNTLDRFKILLGMATTTPMDVAGAEGIDLTEPAVDEPTAIATALKYRLDLLNTLDAIDDARRGVLVAKNNMLPDLNFSGSVTEASDPKEKNAFSYNTERTTWRGLLELEIPFDRVAERNKLRSSVIGLRRAERNYGEAADNVRLDVRRALRQLETSRTTMDLQRRSITINETRRELARLQYDKGQVGYTVVVDAQNEWRDSVNAFAQAEAEYRLAVLEFLRDTGTLRVGDDGRWVMPQDLAPSPAEAAAAEPPSAPLPGSAALPGIQTVDAPPLFDVDD